jgi:hypothetical protein
MKKILIALTLLLCPLCVNASSKNIDDHFGQEEVNVEGAPFRCPLCAGNSSESGLDVDGDEKKKESTPKSTSVEKVEIPNVEDVFPERETHYTKQEFLAGFKGLVHSDLWEDFETGWSAIYDAYTEALEANKPVRRLSATKETEHIHCFYDSFVLADPTDEDFLDMQTITIYSRFIIKTHLDLIAAKDSALAEKITLFMGS